MPFSSKYSSSALFLTFSDLLFLATLVIQTNHLVTYLIHFVRLFMHARNFTQGSNVHCMCCIYVFFLFFFLLESCTFTSNSHSPAGSPIDKSSNCLSKLELLLRSPMTREIICCNETDCQGDRIKFSFWSQAEFHLAPRLKTA